MQKRQSASRTWCKICHIWIADNKIQKRQHEEASKHKQAKLALLKDIAEKNEKKAKEEKKAASLALRGTGAGQAGGRSAEVAQQLLDTVARAVAKKNAPQSRKRPREVVVQEDAEVTVICGSAAEEAPVEEQLDENGFPLPASAVYGQWQAVTEDLDGEAHDTEHLYWGQGPTDGEGGNEEISKGNDYKDEDENQETTGTKVRETEEEKSPEARAVVKGAFKRRVAPQTRRVRRKTTRR